MSITGRRSIFGRLPLVWKVLVPFLALMISLGVLGGFLIVRDLSTRAQTSLDRDLTRRSLDARSLVRDGELYLLESASFAANLQGLPGPVAGRDAGEVARLLESVIALKRDLSLLAVTDRAGRVVAAFRRDAPGEAPRRSTAADGVAGEIVAAALSDPEGRKSSAFLKDAGRTHLAIGTRICKASPSCSPVGVAVVAVEVGRLVSARGAAPDEAGSVTLFDPLGTVLASSAASPPALRENPGARLVRRTHRTGGREWATLYGALTIQDVRRGTLAVGIPTDQAFSSVRRAGLRLALILFVAMICVVAFGTWLSRSILRQVRAILETNRAIGRGDLARRAPVSADDELGELARGVNEMAGQLQASYETMEERVSQRTEEVQRLLNQRTDFFAGISHEFRTPLGVIGRQADMMLSPRFSRNGKWRTQAGTTIRQAVDQLGSFIDDILDMAKAEAGRLDVDVAEFALDELLGELRTTIEGLAAASDIKILLDVPRMLPAVWTDRKAFRAVVLNLVDNAVKYTPPGGAITIAAKLQDDVVQVSVSDTGVGIPPAAAARVFEPFYRVPGTRTQRGQASSGLGLALAKRVVEAQGGSLWLVGEPGAGTTFTFTLMPAGSDAPTSKPSVRGRRRGLGG